MWKYKIYLRDIRCYIFVLKLFIYRINTAPPPSTPSVSARAMLNPEKGYTQGQLLYIKKLIW